ncbi:hypothetical protein BSKO_12170 [Bryopsis sp. KO-2023]|nr:hypothetical protein BSKO_12170 [Bryopsis sp. KO-2023]
MGLTGTRKLNPVVVRMAVAVVLDLVGKSMNQTVVCKHGSIMMNALVVVMGLTTGEVKKDSLRAMGPSVAGTSGNAGSYAGVNRNGVEQGSGSGDGR